VQPTATPHRSGALTAQGIGTAHTGGGTAYQRQRWRSCPVGSPAHPAVRCASSQRKAGPCSVSVPHGNAETNLRAEGEHAGAGRGGRHGGEAQSGLRGGCGDSGNERGLHVSVKNWVQVGFVLCVRAEFVVLGFRFFRAQIPPPGPWNCQFHPRVPPFESIKDSFSALEVVNWAKTGPKARLANCARGAKASALQRRATRPALSLTASRAWTQMGSIFTFGSALWTRCSLLSSRSAPLCWRSSACGLLPSFFLDRRKRRSGRTWLCRAIFPTPRAPSLCIAFAPTSWSRTVWDQCLGMLPVLIHRQCLGLAMDGCTHARGRLSWRYWPLS